jgi:5'-nucleotidase
VLYSGTVSAATEGAFLGIKSAAISLNTRVNPDFGFPARFSREIIRFMKENGLRDRTALNVNIPAVPSTEIRGVVITRQGLSRFRERFERRVDPRGNVYYWLTGETPVEDRVPDADAVALKKNEVTITPISYDLTCVEEVERLRACAMPDLKRIPEP